MNTHMETKDKPRSEARGFPYTGELATPDRIRAWDMDVELWRMPCVVLVYHVGNLYAERSPKTHRDIYMEWKIPTPGLDCRISTERKIFTFWYKSEDGHTPGKVKTWISEIVEKLHSGDFISDTVGKLDVHDYRWCFMTPDGPARTDLAGLMDVHEFSDSKRPWKPYEGVPGSPLVRGNSHENPLPGRV